MINGKRVICIIPARGGSKGLPGKNIRSFCGKPLLGWTLEQAQQSKLIDTIVVSTDDPAIADVAESFGVKVPSLRPAHLAADTSTSFDVMAYTLDLLEQQGQHFDLLVLLEATSPLRDVADIDGALTQLAHHPIARSIVGVSKTENAHPSFLFAIKEGLMTPFAADLPKGGRRQDLVGEYYYLEGSVYASDIATLRKEKGFYHDKCLPWIVPKEKALEIDDLYDFIQAEALMQFKLSHAAVLPSDSQ